MPDPISSSKNPTVRSVAALSSRKGRRATNQFLIEGPNLFAAAVDAGLRFDTVLATDDDTDTQQRAEKAGIEVTLVTGAVLRSAADAENPRSPVAAARRPQGASPRDVNTVVLVDIADPGNVGTIVRTAAAFGWDVAVTPRTADIWSPKVVRAGAGAHFSTSISEVEDPSVFGSSHTVIATVPGRSTTSVPGNGPYAVLIGSEAHGLEPHVVEAADVRLSVPMDGKIESLNASVAAGIVMFIVGQSAPDA